MSSVSFKKPIKNFIVLEGLDGCGKRRALTPLPLPFCSLLTGMSMFLGKTGLQNRQDLGKW